MIKQALGLLACILLTMAVGGISGFATIDGVNGWYRTLSKPSFNPPNYLFGPVWSLLYILMGISLFLVLRAKPTAEKRKALGIFTAQLVLNFFWSILFFRFHQIGFAFAEIVLMWVFILWMIIAFRPLSKTASYLQLPYLAWVSFASVLNGAILYLN
jgi:tryptophan-rich sensory protein